MSDTVKRVLERRASLVNQMREVAERAVNEGRNMSAEEDRQFTEMNAEVDALQRRADAMLEGEQRAKETEEAFSRLNGKPVERKAEDRGDADLRAFLRGEAGRLYEVRADQTTSNAAGIVPSGFYGSLWEYMIETSGILQASPTVLNTDSGETIKIPKATAHSSTASATEGTAITASDPTFGSDNLTVSKSAYTMQVSRELLDDSGVDLQGYLSRSAGRALGNAVGSNAVSVLLAGVSSAVTGPTGATGGLGVQSTAGSGFDKLIDLYHSVIAPYRASSSCVWLMSDPTAASVRKVKSADGVYAWQPSVVAGQPDLILGKPVHIDTNVPDVALSAESILFGDLKSLYVRIAGGFRFERSDDFAFDADLVTFRAIVRHGAVHVDSNAVKSFVGAGT